MGNCQKINLLIKSSQGYVYSDMNDFELFTTGTLKKLKSSWMICYQNENQGTTKITLFSDQTATIKSDGKIAYTFRFIQNKVTKSSLCCQDLFSSMSLKATKIHHKLTLEGGTVALEYDMNVESKMVVKNKLFISINLCK